MIWWTREPCLKWKPTRSAGPVSARNIPIEMTKGNGTSEGGEAIFIEVFLSKTLVNIEMAPSIHDALLLPQLNNSWPPQGCIFFSSNQLSCLYILTKHVASDDRKRYNSWKEIRATHKLHSELYSLPLFFLTRISCTCYIYVCLCVFLLVQVGKDDVVLFTLPLTHLDW